MIEYMSRYARLWVLVSKLQRKEPVWKSMILALYNQEKKRKENKRKKEKNCTNPWDNVRS